MYAGEDGSSILSHCRLHPYVHIKKSRGVIGILKKKSMRYKMVVLKIKSFTSRANVFSSINNHNNAIMNEN